MKLGIEITQEMGDELDKIANAHLVPVEDVVRMALSYYLLEATPKRGIFEDLFNGDTIIRILEAALPLFKQIKPEAFTPAPKEDEE